MKRIIMMFLMNFWYLPYGLTRLFRTAAHPEKLTMEERYAIVKDIDNRAIKGGRVVVDGHGLENIPEKDVTLCRIYVWICCKNRKSRCFAARRRARVRIALSAALFPYHFS